MIISHILILLLSYVYNANTLCLNFSNSNAQIYKKKILFSTGKNVLLHEEKGACLPWVKK